MKNVRLLCLALLMAGSANAQYFQHLYGGTTQDFLESGVNVSPFAPQGHIMAGYTDVSGISNTLMVTRTDLNGNIGPFPQFNNQYPILENGVQVDAKGRRVVHHPSQRICVWGDFGNTPGAVSTKFFYTLLAPNGIPGPVVSYVLPFPVAEAEATSMCLGTSAATANSVFVCGWIRNFPGGPRTPIIMRLNFANGAIIWAFNYTINASVPVDWATMDLVESPYPSSVGGDVALTGQITQPFMPVQSGFFFTVSSANGLVSSPVITYGTPTDNGGFNAIEIANNGFGSGPGYVLGGYINNPVVGNDDSWAMKIDPTGNIVNFSTLHDYFISDFDYANDIIERKNTAGAFEYYLGGYVNNGVFGANDDLVYKLNFAGAPVPAGQFTYGGPGNEKVSQLDQYNGIGPNNDGLSVYGNTDGGSWPFLGGNDFYLVKSYFNGITRCNWDTQTYDTTMGPAVFLIWQARNPNRLTPRPLTIGYSPMMDSTICFGTGVPGGNNARMSQVQQALSQPGYFPNPVSRDHAVVTVTFGNAVAAGEAEIELWNSLGQLCWTKKSSLTDGQTEMQIELGNELSNGMYHLIVRQNGSLNNYRILVQ